MRALAARRSSPARPPPGAASRGVSRARACVAAVPASGSWSRSRRHPSAAERTPSPSAAAAMATTVTCTRFTDEYQLYEDIGK